MRVRATPVECVLLIARIVHAAASEKEPNVTLQTWMMEEILPLLERIAKSHGRPPLTGRQRVHENVVILLARIRKSKLIAAGVLNRKAADQAALEAQARLRDRNLSVETIKRRMQMR